MWQRRRNAVVVDERLVCRLVALGVGARVSLSCATTRCSDFAFSAPTPPSTSPSSTSPSSSPARASLPSSGARLAPSAASRGPSLPIAARRGPPPPSAGAVSARSFRRCRPQLIVVVGSQTRAPLAPARRPTTSATPPALPARSDSGPAISSPPTTASIVATAALDTLPSYATSAPSTTTYVAPSAAPASTSSPIVDAVWFDATLSRQAAEQRLTSLGALQGRRARVDSLRLTLGLRSCAWRLCRSLVVVGGSRRRGICIVCRRSVRPLSCSTTCADLIDATRKNNAAAASLHTR